MDKRDVTIGSPCTLDWRTMTPRDGGRFCGECKKVVRDLSSMTEREAKTLLRRPDNASLCVRYVYDAQGRIIFGNESKARLDLVPATLLSRARRAAAALATVALPFATQACDALDTTSYASDQQELSRRPTHQEPAGESMGGAPYMPPDSPEDAGASPDASTAEGVDSGADASSHDESDASADDGGGVDIY